MKYVFIVFVYILGVLNIAFCGSFMQGHWYDIDKKYPQYRAPISVGRVAHVLSGDLIKLDNVLILFYDELI